MTRVSRVARQADRPEREVQLDKGHTRVLIVVVAAIATAVTLPYPLTKVILGATLAGYWSSLLLRFDARFTGMFVLLLPTFQLLPLEALGVPGLNWQTVFLLIFLLAAMLADAPASRLAVSGWMTYFSVVLVLMGAYAVLASKASLWPTLTFIKNWLFPFSLFLLGRRCFSKTQDLWFVFLCVAIVSFAMALHGLREGITVGNLLTNRPIGLLTGQANLFGGYLAMYGMLFFVVAAMATELRRAERIFLTATGFLMVATLVFTLSRGAWLAFAVTAGLVGFSTSRRLVIILVFAFLVGSRWAPEEAVSRTELTVTALEESEDSSLEESFDDSASLRITQWKWFPQLYFESPLWGTGLGTYPERMGQATGIFRSAHAMMIGIGTEMGAFGLVGYLGLFVAAAVTCVRRASNVSKGSFERAMGVGLFAATICLFLLDLSGTRFRAHTVTTYYWLLLGAFLGTTRRPANSGKPA
jgi:O-antigen ligase